jgi:hypothetical protein
MLTAPLSAQMMQGNKKNNKQGKQQMMGGNMMQSGMMQNMMQGGMGMMNQNMPIKKYMMLINKLPGMSAALSLTDSQTKQLTKMKTDFMKSKIDHQSAIAKKKIDVETLLEDNAPSSEIRSAMEEIANSKIDMHIAAYETANKMKGVLNAEQKESLKNNMMNQGMMQGGMMGNGGMMQNGMMNGGVMNDEDNN